LAFVTIDPRLLLQFAAVAEELSFTAAARRLGVAQPWLSARIRRLEDQMGTALFERSTRRVTLTAIGEQLHRQLGPFAAAFAQASTAIEALRAEAEGVVRLGCPILGEPDARQADLLRTFAGRYPDVIVDVEAGSAATHIEKAQRGLLDMFLSLEELRGAAWECLPLHRVALSVMMHADDPLANRDDVRVADLAGRRLAVFPRRRAPAHFERIYGAMLRAGAQAWETPELRRSLLRDSPGLIVTTIVPAPADAVLRHGVVRREIIDAEPLRMTLIRRRSGFHARAAERFWRLAAEASQAGSA